MRTIYRDMNGVVIKQWDMLRYARIYRGKHARIKNWLYDLLIVNRTTLVTVDDDGQADFYGIHDFASERYEVMGNTLEDSSLLYEHHFFDKP